MLSNAIVQAGATMKETLDLHYTRKKTCQAWARELHRVMCMQGGDDELSYAKNSDAPASAIELSKPLLLEGIDCMNLFHGEASIRVADLGCATGHNTVSTVELVVECLRRRYEASGKHVDVPEFEIFFSDLPSNDFNSLFRSLPSFHRNERPAFYAAGVPGSFYDRLFPKRRLHLAVSFSALHWLSQIPQSVLDEKSMAWNKGRAWIDGARREVVDAYAQQSSEDLRTFLECRREEMVEGGMLFLLLAGRPASQRPENQLGDTDSRIKHAFTITMDQAWQDLLDEGLIDEETRDKFNIPAYMRSTEEVREAFDRCGGFEVRKLEYSRILEHSREKQEEWNRDPASYGKAKANMVRATLKPIVEAHVGKVVAEALFHRYEKRVTEDAIMLRKTCFYGLIVVWAVRTS